MHLEYPYIHIHLFYSFILKNTHCFTIGRGFLLFVTYCIRMIYFGNIGSTVRILSVIFLRYVNAKFWILNLSLIRPIKK